MGIFVRLKRVKHPSYIGPEASGYWKDVWADYVDFLHRTVAFFAERQGYPRFEVKDCSVWDQAPSEALGGSMIAEGEYPEFLNELDIDTQFGLFRSIVRVRGLWLFKESKFEGYCEAHLNPDWRSVYGDFEVDGYPDYEGDSDLTDALWRHNGHEDVVKGYMDMSSSFEGRTSKVHHIFFTPSPSMDKRLDLVRAIYAPNADVLLTAAVKSLRETNRSVDKKASSYNVNFLTSVIRRDKYASRRLDSLLTRHRIKKAAGSVMYIGEHEDSFQKVYAELCSEVLVPAFGALQARSTIRSKVKAAIRHQKPLFDES